MNEWRALRMFSSHLYSQTTNRKRLDDVALVPFPFSSSTQCSLHSVYLISRRFAPQFSIMQLHCRHAFHRVELACVRLYIFFIPAETLYGANMRRIIVLLRFYASIWNCIRTKNPIHFSRINSATKISLMLKLIGLFILRSFRLLLYVC